MPAQPSLDAAAGSVEEAPGRALNLAVVIGRLSRPPAEVTLRSGTVLVRYDVTVPGSDGPSESLPVVWFDPPARARSIAEGAEVIVAGRVRRRFYRGGGALRSSTEVVATTLALATWKRGRSKATAALRDALDLIGDGT